MQLSLCRFSTSFPMNFVTHSKEVCQRLGTCNVIICMKHWIEAACTMRRIVKICPLSHPFKLDISGNNVPLCMYALNKIKFR